METKDRTDNQTPIVFYDGDCGLCDRCIKFLIRIDRNRMLSYSTLQGETAARMLGEPTGDPAVWSIKLLSEGQLYDRSTAVLRAIALTGGFWKVAKLLLAVPRPIRDAVYRWVATNRYRWFGKTDACMVPTPALSERFLP